MSRYRLTVPEHVTWMSGVVGQPGSTAPLRVASTKTDPTAGCIGHVERDGGVAKVITSTGVVTSIPEPDSRS